MSDVRRVQSVTVKDHVKLQRRGHKTDKYIAEYDEDLKKTVCRIEADYSRRVVTIRHLESGDITEIAFEACNQWNPYPPGQEPKDEEKPAARKSA